MSNVAYLVENVSIELSEMKKIGMRVPAKAIKMAKDPTLLMNTITWVFPNLLTSSSRSRPFANLKGKIQMFKVYVPVQFAVYKPVVKAVQKGLYDPRDRVVFYQGGRAMLYRECTLLNPMFNTAEAKKNFKKVKEQMPDRMNAFGRVARQVSEKSLPIPVAVFQF